MYEDRSFRTNFAVGLLTLAVVAGLAAVLGFFLQKERPLADTFPLTVRFSDVQGLKAGAPVTLMGAAVGRVLALEIGEAPQEGTVWLAHLAIRDEAWIRAHLTTTTTFTLQSESVFGNKYVNASFGDRGAPLERGGQVRGIVGAGVDARTFEKLSAALENLSGAAGELRGILAAPEGASATAQPNIRVAIANLDSTLRNASEASTALRGALSNENQDRVKKTFDDISISAANLATVTARMKSGMDTWGETLERMRFWKGWFGGEKEKKQEKEKEKETQTR